MFVTSEERLAQIFPKWTNKLPAYIVSAVTLGGLLIVGFFFWFGSPKFTDSGYRPKQPIPYSHKLHAGDLGIDCRFCHTTVETSPVAVVPPTQTCMVCHKEVLPTSTKLRKVRESFAKNKPIQWIRVHNLPDYVYFNHSVHIDVGVGCSSCHGDIERAEVVMQVKPLSMSWCLSCHRNPDNFLRTRDQITNTEWKPPPGQKDFAYVQKMKLNIKPPDNCSGCHR